MRPASPAYRIYDSVAGADYEGFQGFIRNCKEIDRLAVRYQAVGWSLNVVALNWSSVEFDWDPQKEQSNIQKHGVDFTEAATVFGDPLELTIPDPDHSIGECRYLSIGRSLRNRILVVSYTERENRIRMISARTASPKEQRQYESEK